MRARAGMVAGLTLGLAACSGPDLDDQVNIAEAGAGGPAGEARALCTADAGVIGSRTGVRAQQYVGPGAKRRLVIWQTPDWDIPDGKTEAQLPGEGPRLAIKAAWRVSVVNGNAESSLESLSVRTREVDPADLEAARSWELLVVDGEAVQIPIEAPGAQAAAEASFTTEDGQNQLPGLISEAIGGVNGGRFTVRLLDYDGAIIADKDVRPLRGYEFKEQALEALAALDQKLASPQACLRVGAG